MEGPAKSGASTRPYFKQKVDPPSPTLSAESLAQSQADLVCKALSLQSLFWPTHQRGVRICTSLTPLK